MAAHTSGADNPEGLSATARGRHPVLDERAALCELMVDLGPDAPTWCGDWTTAELAAHLVVRETRPDAGPGLLIGGWLARHTERVRTSAVEIDGDAEAVQRFGAVELGI